MGFVNDGPWAYFESAEGLENNFTEVKFVTSSNPSSYNDNIKTEKGAIFIMEVYQINPQGMPYYTVQSVTINKSNGYPVYDISKLGGNGTYTPHTNSTSDGIVLGFETAAYTLKTYMRVTPIVGNVEILG